MNHAANSRQISDKETVVSRKRKFEKEKKTRASWMILFFFSFSPIFQPFFSFSRIVRRRVNFHEETYERYLLYSGFRKFTISIDFTRKFITEISHELKFNHTFAID